MTAKPKYEDLEKKVKALEKVFRKYKQAMKDLETEQKFCRNLAKHR
jgi:hypothetical protein